MNWGNKLILVFIAFAALMFTMVYKAMNTKFDLVSKAYYEDELRYQDKIDGKRNAATLGALTIAQDDAALKIQLPAGTDFHQLEGEAWFYCKTDAGMDLRLPLKLNVDGEQVIPLKMFKASNYQLKLSWVNNGEHYYMEKDIALN